MPNVGARLLDEKGNQMGVGNNPTSIIEESRTSPPVDFHFAKSTGTIPTTLTSATAIDDTVISVASATGFSNGDLIAVVSGDRIYEAHIVSIATLDFTLDTPLDFAFPSGSVVLEFTREMAVNGSITPQTFVVQSSATGTLSFMVTRLLLQVQCTETPDFGKFGDIATGLAKGIIVRVVNGTTRNLFNIKTNGDMAVIAYDVAFYDAAKFGNYGIGVRLTFGSLGKHGTSFKITPGDAIEVIIQDDLSGLVSMKAIAEGYVIE